MNFMLATLNRLLGTLNVDPQPMTDILLRPPYRETQHTLSGPISVAWWTRHQQFGYHITFSYSHMSREKEEVDYRLRYDLNGLDMTKIKKPQGLHSPVLFVSEFNVHIDNILSHLSVMKTLQLRMSRVTTEQLQQLNIDYPLSEHSRALCKLGL
ncbi:hypothetical protein HAX54_020924, partial [Datura stramonium]|nr:hypothetical protein [Datura stramonium]